VGEVVDWRRVDELMRAGSLEPPRQRVVAPYVVDADGARAMVRAAVWPHYVYMLCGEAGDVFYVGKGVGARAFVHAAEAAAGADGDKAEMLRRLGSSVRYCLIGFFERDEDALLREAILIEALWPVLLNARKDTAFNVSKGIHAKTMADEAQACMDAALEFEEIAQGLRARAASLLESSSVVRRMKRGGRHG